VLIERLQFIAGNEKIEVSNDAMEALLETSEGDLRKAITSLQSCAKFKEGEEITNDDVFEMSGVVPDAWMCRLFEVCKQNSFDKLQNFVDELICEGFSVAQLILQLHTAVVSDSHSVLSDLQKSTVCEALAVAENCLVDGASEYLQLLDVCAILMKVMS
jgi:replication factor C subunit 2/4